MLLDRPIQNIPGDLPRKWLFDDVIELVIWYSIDQQIYGFQIIYNLDDHAKALTFHPEKGFSHHFIDSGEHDPNLNQSPVLSEASSFKIHDIIDLFRLHSAGISEDVKSFVFDRLSEFANTAQQDAAANP